MCVLKVIFSFTVCICVLVNHHCSLLKVLSRREWWGRCWTGRIWIRLCICVFSVCVCVRALAVKLTAVLFWELFPLRPQLWMTERKKLSAACWSSVWSLDRCLCRNVQHTAWVTNKQAEPLRADFDWQKALLVLIEEKRKTWKHKVRDYFMRILRIFHISLNMFLSKWQFVQTSKLYSYTFQSRRQSAFSWLIK